MTAPGSTVHLTHPRYVPGEILGQGSQGVVLRVSDRERPTRALVAKIFRAGASDATALRGEFALLARLNISGLVRAHDLAFDQVTGAPFLVEDFVSGIDATEFVWNGDERGRVSRLVLVLIEVARTLAELHDAGFTHGDLKPAHVRIRTHGQVVVLDLGTATAMALPEALRLYTPAFAAPELIAGAPMSIAADLFGLGALGFALATRSARRGARLRDAAAWVPPSVAHVLETLVSEHPRDRPSSAFEVIRLLGGDQRASTLARGALASPIGRHTELAWLTNHAHAGVRYVVGPSGIGKSHLLREVRVRALLDGREVRYVDFPFIEPSLVARLVAFFRGDMGAWPFTLRAPDEPPLCIFDNLHSAPVEFIAALDAFRCRAPDSTHIAVLVSDRTAPEGAEKLQVSVLTLEAFAELSKALGIESSSELERAWEVTRGNPGWLVALSGRVPLSDDMVLERATKLSHDARAMLAAVAVSGGTAPIPLVRAVTSEAAYEGALSELLSASLIERNLRQGTWVYSLPARSMAAQIGSALASCEIVDAVASAALSLEERDLRVLLAIAQAPCAATCREELLEEAAQLARAHGLRSEEIEALFALAANPRKRTAELLRRIERLTRDAGSSSLHPQVLQWLEVTAPQDDQVKLLWLRRAAEQAARAGETQTSEELALAALSWARTLADGAANGLALSTLGAIALYRSDWERAERYLTSARAEFAIHELSDAEELARLDHNFGIVALFRNDLSTAIAAFERSLACKRRLGDRAGVRSCLLNLGLALARAGRHAEAKAVLSEAIKLARSLQQTGGLAWCLAARADVEVRVEDPESAEQWVSEAEALGEAVPAAVRADLAILRAEIALLRGEGMLALTSLGHLEPALRAKDQMLDCRAKIIEARAQLAMLPVDRLRAARLAIAAVRIARKARLADHEQMAVSALRKARAFSRRQNSRYAPGVSSIGDSRNPVRENQSRSSDIASPIWKWLRFITTGASLDEVAVELARVIVKETQAERVLIAHADAEGTIIEAWGADLDGFAISEPAQRFDVTFLNAALASQTPLYQRQTGTHNHSGSRLAVAANPGMHKTRALIFIEHRFRAYCFDALSEEQIGEYITLASLLARLAKVSAPVKLATTTTGAGSESANANEPSLTSTVLPLSAPKSHFPEIIGSADSLKRALAQLEAAAESNLPVLLEGETGTGKELFARALHNCSARRTRAFVAVNCAAIPESLFEAEFFGHMRGAFTNAEKARPGLFASAEKGTLLLDEVGELALPRQAALLRVLETRRYRPVGSDDEREFDVRIVAATNRNLEQEVELGHFRRDLLYRLNVVHIRIPPLRERANDIPDLVQAILERAGAQTIVSDPALRALMSYRWPGNVRELQHCIERLAAVCRARIELSNLPREIRRESSGALHDTARREPTIEVERALRAANGNITHAAKALGLTRHGLKKRMARLGMRTDPKGTR